METRGDDGWFFRLVRERSPRAERLRRRCAATGAAVVLVVGFATAIDPTLLVPAALAVLVLAAAAVVTLERRACMGLALQLWSWLRRDAPGEEGWPLPASSVAMGSDEEVTVETTVVARPGSAGMRRRVTAALVELLPSVERRVGGAVAGAHGGADDARGVADVEGSRCNALGLALRRAGRSRQAAALHEAALLIFARLGDRRAEALAANALGVALVESGDQEAALEQFERARTLLHELGDRHWEGKVLANVGLAKHRIGRDDEALELLRTALAHLAPGTEAYRRVERRITPAG